MHIYIYIYTHTHTLIKCIGRMNESGSESERARLGLRVLGTLVKLTPLGTVMPDSQIQNPNQTPSVQYCRDLK